MSRNAPRMHLECCRNLIPYEMNSAGMHFKCRQKLSIAARSRLECSRNVPNCSRVIDDVIIPPSNFLTKIFERPQNTFSVCTEDLPGRHAAKEEGT